MDKYITLSEGNVDTYINIIDGLVVIELTLPLKTQKHIWQMKAVSAGA